MAYPERIVPDETPAGPLAIHEKRYQFALPYCAGKRVLDAACGVGYGSAILAGEATEVVGIDLDEEAIAYARSRYCGPNIEFRTDDLQAPSLEDRDFDVVCSFETLEHLPDRDAFLHHVARVLRDDGTLVLSTPRVDETTESPDNPHHFVEYSRRDFEGLLARYFDRVEVFGQRRAQTRRHRALQRLDVLGLRKRFGFLRPASRLLGTAPMAEVALDDVLIEQTDLDRATELVAVCRGPRR